MHALHVVVINLLTRIIRLFACLRILVLVQDSTRYPQLKNTIYPKNKTKTKNLSNHP